MKKRPSDTAAGIAAANARRYEQAKAHQSWIEATRDIATALLSGAVPATVLRLVAEETLKLTAAEAALVAVPVDDTEPPAAARELLVVETVGNSVAFAGGLTIPVAATSPGEVLLSSTPRTADCIDVGGTTLGPALVLPLRAVGTVAGVVVVLHRPAAGPFTDEDFGMMAVFADQAAVALELATSQRRMRELDVVTERDRIARDLHDHVIQRLFAIGLALQGIVPRTRDAEVRRRLTEAVDDLQGVMQKIQATMFDLNAPPHGAARLRRRIEEAIAQLADTRLRTAVRFVGPLSVVDGTLADHAEAVVREALKIAARHPQATTVTVRVTVADDLCIEVSHDGRGMPETPAGDALEDLRRRAAQAGGQLATVAATDTGETLRWSAPLP